MSNTICNNCKHYDYLQEFKIYGSPCNIHGDAGVKQCDDFKEKPEMEWYVYYHDFNKRKLTKYNVFDHGRFVNDLIRLDLNKLDKISFSVELDKLVQYYFWSKSEWEIIISPWCGQADDIKIDVYDQLHMNWDVFVNYCYERMKS